MSAKVLASSENKLSKPSMIQLLFSSNTIKIYND